MMVPATKRHNYKQGILELAQSGCFAGLEPALYVLDVQHDGWCAFLRDRTQRCDCQPDYRLRRAGVN